jgi:hypothetical protein
MLLVGPYLLLGLGRAVSRWWLPAAAVLGAWVGWGVFVGLAGRGRWTPYLPWRPPFAGYLETRFVDLPATLLYIVVPAVVLAAATGWALRRRPADPALWAVLLNALFVFWMPTRSAELLWHSARLSTGLPLAALLADDLARSAPRWWRALAVLLLTSASWTIAVTVRYLCCGVVVR